MIAFKVPANLFNPCKKCRYFDKGECKLFKYQVSTVDDKKTFDFYVDAEMCRRDEELCGNDGKYFKLKK